MELDLMIMTAFSVGVTVGMVAGALGLVFFVASLQGK
jgi:hypothetical protein